MQTKRKRLSLTINDILKGKLIDEQKRLLSQKNLDISLSSLSVSLIRKGLTDLDKTRVKYANCSTLRR